MVSLFSLNTTTQKTTSPVPNMQTNVTSCSSLNKKKRREMPFALDCRPHISMSVQGINAFITQRVFSPLFHTQQDPDACNVATHMCITTKQSEPGTLLNISEIRDLVMVVRFWLKLIFTTDPVASKISICCLYQGLV